MARSISIGEIAVNVTARTQKFAKQLKAGEKPLKSFGASARKVVASLGKIGGAVAAAGAAFASYKLIATFRATADEMDRIGKMSDRLGMATEALIGLHHAADINGIAIQSMNMGLQRMTRRVSQAAAKGGPLADMMQNMGLSAQQLATMDPAEQFERITAALNRVPQADRIRHAFAFFDSEGVDLVRLAGQNLKQYREEAERLGRTFTREEATRMEQFNDSMTRMGQAFQGLGRRFMIDIAPVAVTVVAKLEKMIIDLDLAGRAARGLTGLGSSPVKPSIQRQLGERFGTAGSVIGGVAGMNPFAFLHSVTRHETRGRDVATNPLRGMFREMFAPGSLPGVGADHNIMRRDTRQAATDAALGRERNRILREMQVWQQQQQNQQQRTVEIGQ